MTAHRLLLRKDASVLSHREGAEMSKVWFVTGANSGFGKSIAKAALAAGDQVVATARNMDKLRSAFPDASNHNLALVQLDVADVGQANAAIAEAIRRFNRIDVLVNNAGNSYLGNFEELTNGDIESQMTTNFYGVVNVLRAALPILRKQRGGHIINISSTAGVAGFKHCTAYSASKFAVEGLTLSLVPEVEQFGIKLTIVEPGFFRTSLLAANNVSYAKSSIADYAHEGTAETMWSGFDGKQPNDPDKLGEALLKLSNMPAPPRFFVAGLDALDAVRPVMEARLTDMQAHEDLSKAMVGN
jgi:NAD(P)-dependent dehydrogenase (short-subunit alcohol dehydrogenase family)